MLDPIFSAANDLPAIFTNARFGDARLNRRAKLIMERAQAAPSASFPRMMPNGSELEGLYRFIENDAVTPAALIDPFIQATLRHVGSETEVLVVADTTDIGPSRSAFPDDMGYLTSTRRGFHLHVSLAVRPGQPNLPLGVLDASFHHRGKERKRKVHPRQRAKEPDSESVRWRQAAQRVREAVGPNVRVVHVMDREADDYKLFAALIAQGDDFVIRVARDRCLDAHEEPAKLYDALHDSECVAVREVSVSKRLPHAFEHTNRIHPPRDARMATLHVRYASVRIKRPSSAPSDLPSNLDLQVVEVFEPNPPEGEAPITWRLLTPRTVASAADAMTVVDHYRQRWVIEEFFKALKTGTGLLERQVESVHTLENVVALSLPLAWHLLVVRSVARREPNLPAKTYFSISQLYLLRHLGRIKISEEPTLHEVSFAVAALGGHLKRNGAPGWQTLAAGLLELRAMERAWALPRPDQRCDQ